MIIRSYRYRLYPNKEQAETLSCWQQACWEVQRLCIRQRRIAANKLKCLVWGGYKKNKRTGKMQDVWYSRTNVKQPTWVTQGRETTELRNADYPDMPSDMLLTIPKRVDEAYKKAYKEWKPGKRIKVRWADKAEYVGLQFRGIDRGTQMVGQRGRYAYWKIAGASRLGTFKVRSHRPLPDGAIVRQAHITRAADGWYISLSCEVPDPVPAPTIHGEALGGGNHASLAPVQVRPSPNIKNEQRRHDNDIPGNA